MKVHHLKTWRAPFQAVWDDIKTFEFRRDDRGFNVGDRLYLLEWDETNGLSLNRQIIAAITYMVSGPAFGIPDGYCVMSMVLKRKIDDGEIVWFSDSVEPTHDA